MGSMTPVLKEGGMKEAEVCECRRWAKKSVLLKTRTLIEREENNCPGYKGAYDHHWNKLVSTEENTKQLFFKRVLRKKGPKISKGCEKSNKGPSV